MRVGYQISYAGYVYFVRHYDVIAGSYLGLGVVGTNMSAKTFDHLKSNLEKTQGILNRKNKEEFKKFTKNQLLGDRFVTGVYAYYSQYINDSTMNAKQKGVNHLLLPSIGTFGYEPHQRTFFGLNRGVQADGAYMNMYLNYITQEKNGNKDKNKSFNKEVGMLSSILEHSIPERVFANPNNLKEMSNGFSAAKFLGLANAGGQRLYTIKQQNQQQALSNLTLDSAAMTEIRQALASGKEVMTHTNLITVNGYKGAGYVVLDPETGSGAYKISGGKNGGGTSGSCESSDDASVACQIKQSMTLYGLISVQSDGGDNDAGSSFWEWLWYIFGLVIGVFSLLATAVVTLIDAIIAMWDCESTLLQLTAISIGVASAALAGFILGGILIALAIPVIGLLGFVIGLLISALVSYFVGLFLNALANSPACRGEQ